VGGAVSALATAVVAVLLAHARGTRAGSYLRPRAGNRSRRAAGGQTRRHDGRPTGTT